jgi:hypothetical protein
MPGSGRRDISLVDATTHETFHRTRRRPSSKIADFLDWSPFSARQGEIAVEVAAPSDAMAAS